MTWALLRLSLVLIAAGAVAFSAAVTAMALRLLRPERMGDGRAMYFLRRLSPADIGLPHETIHFSVMGAPSAKALRIAAWWIPPAEPSERCVVLVHGYTDAKVGAIAWAPLLRSLGFGVLAVDLRAHGDSGGAFSTAGFFERHDLMAVIDQFKSAHPDQTRRVVLFGISLGAASLAATAVLRDDLAAVILESPYLDFPSAVLSRADNLGVPGKTFQLAALRFAQVLARCDYSQVRPIDLIGKIRCPLLVIQSGCDPFVPAEDQRRMAAAVAARPPEFGPSRLWRAEDCHHVVAMAERPAEYRRQIAEFLDEALMDAASKKQEMP